MTPFTLYFLITGGVLITFSENTKAQKEAKCYPILIEIYCSRIDFKWLIPVMPPESIRHLNNHDSQ